MGDKAKQGEANAIARKRKPPCKVEGCGAVHNARGYCKRHYWRYMKYGDMMERRTRFEIIEKLSDLAYDLLAVYYLKTVMRDDVRDRWVKKIEDVKKGIF